MVPLLKATNKDEVKQAFDEIIEYVDENDEDYQKKNTNNYALDDLPLLAKRKFIGLDHQILNF